MAGQYGSKEGRGNWNRIAVAVKVSMAESLTEEVAMAVCLEVTVAVAMELAVLFYVTVSLI